MTAQDMIDEAIRLRDSALIPSPEWEQAEAAFADKYQAARQRTQDAIANLSDSRTLAILADRLQDEIDILDDFDALFDEINPKWVTP